VRLPSPPMSAIAATVEFEVEIVKAAGRPPGKLLE
jgi:hypothetical protein